MLFEAIRSFFTPGYSFSLCNSTLIHFCRLDFALVENRLDSSYDDIRNECLLRLSWALAHSRRPEDVQRGIRMLEGEKGSSVNTDDTLQMKLKAYILAVGYYRSGDYSKSLDHVNSCLEIAYDWEKAISLKKAIEVCIKKGTDGMTGMHIDTTAVGVGVGVLVAGGLAAIGYHNN